MKNKTFKLSYKAIAAINAVEGLYLSDESKARLSALDVKGLTADKQIEAILKAYKERTA